MRTETIMKQDIVSFIKKRPDIRLAYLNGSRANPHAPKDCYQDYDLVLVVADLKPYFETNDWLSELGTVALIQEPDHAIKGCDDTQCYGWLVLFDDHNRIDLTIETVGYFESKKMDSMTVPFYDPEGYLKTLPKASDRDYWIQKPTEVEFHDVINNFWWCLNNVGKGIIRDELPYALHMFHYECIHALDRVIEWDIALKFDYKINSGKHGKWFKDFMDAKTYQTYLEVYPSSKSDSIWHAINVAMDLMHILGRRVAEQAGYAYFDFEENAIRTYMMWVEQRMLQEGL